MEDQTTVKSQITEVAHVSKRSAIPDIHDPVFQQKAADEFFRKRESQKKAYLKNIEKHREYSKARRARERATKLLDPSYVPRAEQLAKARLIMDSKTPEERELILKQKKRDAQEKEKKMKALKRAAYKLYQETLQREESRQHSETDEVATGPEDTPKTPNSVA
mgnify:CR=1 FL=1